MLFHLVLLFNAIVALEYVPTCFKLAFKIPIPKGNAKHSKTFDDHRGISLLPVLDNILQRLVLNRILKQPISRIHRLQGAYQSQQSALTTACMIDETIKSCCEVSEKVYACFVDKSKSVINKGSEAIALLASVGCRHGDLNPRISVKLWKSIALPHMLYGCELYGT